MRKTIVFIVTMVLCHLAYLGKADIKPEQKLSDYLWEQTTQYQEEALNTSYIYGLSQGCLNPEQFGAYMVQDSVFCKKAMESIEIAANRTTNVTVQKFLDEQAASYKGYWEWLYEVWHINQTDGITLGSAAADYIAHERNIAETEDSAYFILAITPCAKLWPWIGGQIQADTGDFGVYTNWVRSNLDPTSDTYKTYQDYVESAYEAGTVQANKALAIFTASMQGEVNFFNSVERCAVSGGGTDSIHTNLVFLALILQYLIGHWL